MTSEGLFKLRATQGMLASANRRLRTYPCTQGFSCKRLPSSSGPCTTVADIVKSCKIQWTVCVRREDALTKQPS